MCIAKGRTIRPGIGGIVDYIDIIEEVKRKLSPLLSLMIWSVELNPMIGDVFTNEGVSDLGALIRDMLDEAFEAADGIYEIFQQEVKR